MKHINKENKAKIISKALDIIGYEHKDIKVYPGTTYQHIHIKDTMVTSPIIKDLSEAGITFYIAKSAEKEYSLDIAIRWF